MTITVTKIVSARARQTLREIREFERKSVVAYQQSGNIRVKARTHPRQDGLDQNLTLDWM